MRYAGEYVATVTREDYERGYMERDGRWLSGWQEALGRLQEQDIGKQLYRVRGVLYAENSEQYARRLAEEKQT